MRVAAILGLGSSTRDLNPFQSDRVEWAIGLPASSAGLDAILVFGGDGTVHRHLAALVQLALPVLVIPAGSGNDFARALGLFRERESLEAWAAFVSDHRNLRAVDLGTIMRIENGPAPAPDSAQKTNADGQGHASLNRPADLSMPTYFSCAAGVGLDGEIARRANALPRWLRARGGYALSLPAALLRFRPFVLHLSTAGSDRETEFRLRSSQPVTAAVFANTAVYGGGMKVAPRAQMDDGQLDICVIRDISKLKLLSVFPSVYLGRHLGIREVEYFSASAARVETEHPVDVYADGEYICQTPVQIAVAKGVLRVIVPG
jgi:diacylglycerol kinase (ATP)